MVILIGQNGENVAWHVVEEFRHENGPVPIPRRLVVGQHVLSKIWDQQRNKRNATHKIAVSQFEGYGYIHGALFQEQFSSITFNDLDPFGVKHFQQSFENLRRVMAKTHRRKL